jgi:hypothetical protein
LSASVVRAQAAAVAAQAEVEHAKIAAAKEQLLAVRAEGRKVAKELRALVGQIRRIDGELILLEHERVDLANAVHAHVAEKPDLADFPSDKELAAWQTELDRLMAEQLATGRRIIDAKHEHAYPLQETLQLDMRLANLRRGQTNLERIINGEELGWQGGISRI